MGSEPRWILALDASTPRCVLALGRVDGDAPALVVGDDEDDGPNQASTRLLPRVERALRDASIEASQLSAVACGRGPGTFTGTRVAVASAKGLAYGIGCPVVPVSTLAAVAASAEVDGEVLAILDARRGEVYGGPWRCERPSPGPPIVRPTGEERVAPLPVLGSLPYLEGVRDAEREGSAGYTDLVPRSNVEEILEGLRGLADSPMQGK